MTATGKCYPYLRVIVETRVNFKPSKGIKLTTRHPRVRRAPRVATIHDDYQRVKSGPPHPSACLPCDTSLGYPWVAHTLSLLPHRAITVGVMGCPPTQRSMKLLSLWDPINLICASTKSNLFTGAKRSVLNRHRRGLPPSEL
jgi:hypothetical protein